MNYSGYISKHLYARYKESKDDIIPVVLDENELAFLNFYGIAYGKKKDAENNTIYLLKRSDLKKAFQCNS